MNHERRPYNGYGGASLVALVLAALTVVACEYRPDPSAIRPGREVGTIDGIGADLRLTVYVVDSCEYIGTGCMGCNNAILAHKGNCRFCAERAEHNRP